MPGAACLQRLSSAGNTRGLIEARLAPGWFSVIRRSSAGNTRGLIEARKTTARLRARAPNVFRGEYPRPH